MFEKIYERGKMKAFSLTEVADIIEAVQEANLTPRQAVKAILGYRANMPTKTVLRLDGNGEIRTAKYGGKNEGYRQGGK